MAQSKISGFPRKEKILELSGWMRINCWSICVFYLLPCLVEEFLDLDRLSCCTTLYGLEYQGYRL
mgnify:CR=1 FL=1